MGEEACQFEHRDLHWGNLLIRRSEEAAASAATRARLRGVDLEAPTAGVTVRRSLRGVLACCGRAGGRTQGLGFRGGCRAALTLFCHATLHPPLTHPVPQVTLIDFTLSRLVTVTGEVAFCDLAADPELFKGPKGSVQVRWRHCSGARRGVGCGCACCTCMHRGWLPGRAGVLAGWRRRLPPNPTRRHPGACRRRRTVA